MQLELVFARTDVVRLFLLWLRTYDDLHMRVVQVIHNDPGATRAFIWEQIHGEEVRREPPAILYRCGLTTALPWGANNRSPCWTIG